MTGKQTLVAVRIDTAIQPLLRDNADDMAILTRHGRSHNRLQNLD